MNEKNRQQILDEIQAICEQYEHQLISFCLRNRKKKKGEQGEFVMISRIAVDDLENLENEAIGKIKH